MIKQEPNNFINIAHDKSRNQKALIKDYVAISTYKLKKNWDNIEKILDFEA